MGSFDERLRVRVNGEHYDSYRNQLRTSLSIGLSHPVAHPIAHNQRIWLDGHGSIGVGPTFQGGHWLVPIREDVTIAFAATHWLTLRTGLASGFAVDTTESYRSFAEIGLPLSITVFRAFELIYRPIISLPMGTQATTTLGGERELSTRLTVLPFEFILRARVGLLAWWPSEGARGMGAIDAHASPDNTPFNTLDHGLVIRHQLKFHSPVSDRTVMRCFPFGRVTGAVTVVQFCQSPVPGIDTTVSPWGVRTVA